jgi:(heptosyl)LPS beta-1,4-glucosyltransferase
MSLKYSIVIIANNAERTIAECLSKAVLLSDDVVLILDDKSEDSTESIARTFPVHLIKYSWQGYSATKNYGASRAQNDWILSVDSDEVPDTRLVEELKGISLNEDTVYQCVRRTWIDGYPVKYCGWYPDKVVRLYHKKHVRWDNHLVHERLIFPASTKVKELKGLLEHYSFENEHHMKEKFRNYAFLRAQEWKQSGKSPSLVKQFMGPAFRFFKTFIIKSGFLDGKYGWMIAKNEYLMKRKEFYYWRKPSDL